MTGTSIDTARIPLELRPAVQGIAQGAVALAAAIRSPDGGAVPPTPAAADPLFRGALQGADLRWYASGIHAQPVMMQPQGRFALALDPLDGAADLLDNVAVGTFFAIYPAEADADASVLRPVRQQIAAGYVMHGPRCDMMLTFGDGVQHYALDPKAGRFRLLTGRQIMPDNAFEFAIDASNYRHWSRPIRAYIDDCLAGAEGPREANFSMRWTGSLVADTHRTLTRGGIFLCPSDARRGHERGRLGLLFHCAPIAFLTEQAGGHATDACDPILERRTETLHQHAPLVFGAARKVARVAAYHDLPPAEVSALFGHRGLFRG